MLINVYYQPTDLNEALEYMNQDGDIKALAGGTDLNILLHERKIRPDAIVDLNRIAELKEIKMVDGMLHIGSMCSFTTVANNDLVKECCPVLAAAASTVGSTQIRNSGTVGGNLANAATAADTVPAFMALDAEVVVRSVDSERILKVTEVPTGLNKTCLAKNELLVKFIVKPTTGKFTDFEKIGRRKALAISRINMAVVMELDGKVIKSAAIASGAVGKTAYRISELEAYLAGKEINEELMVSAGALTEDIVTRVLNGRSTTPYKKKIASACLKRALEKAMGGAE